MKATHADCDHANDYCQVKISAAINPQAAREYAAMMQAALTEWDTP